MQIMIIVSCYGGSAEIVNLVRKHGVDWPSIQSIQTKNTCFLSLWVPVFTSCCCVAYLMSSDVRTSWDQCVSMVQYCLTSTETIRLVRSENPGRPPRLSHSSWAQNFHHSFDPCLNACSCIMCDITYSNVLLVFMCLLIGNVHKRDYNGILSLPKEQKVK